MIFSAPVSRLYRRANAPIITIMKDENYKPRHGFDIRVKPPSAKSKKLPAWKKPVDKICEVESCTEPGDCRTAKSPREPRNYLWFCATHAREHNKQWNYFEGMSSAEAKQARDANIYGGRPTWSWAKNERAAAAGRTDTTADMTDAFGVLGDAAKARAAGQKGTYREGKRLTKLQEGAFSALGLPATAPGGAIRKRYGELLRKFHPDSNEGDRSAEEQLQAVVKAHQILKKAKIC